MQLLTEAPVTTKDMSKFGDLIIAQAFIEVENPTSDRVTYSAGSYLVTCNNTDQSVLALGARLKFAKKAGGLMASSKKKCHEYLSHGPNKA